MLLFLGLIVLTMGAPTAHAATPTLTVIKKIVNDNGGTATLESFTLMVDGGPVANATANGFSVGLHTVSETGPSGYAATFSGACNGVSTVTLAVGDDVTCTITNDDIAPTVDHFVFNPIGSQTVGVPFSITITAVDAGGHTVTSYADTNTLSASAGDISPSSTVAFSSGVWTGSVTLDTAARAMTIHTVGSVDGKIGASNSFVASPNRPPVLMNGRVSPVSGVVTTSFSYFANYFDPEGVAPTFKRVWIDGVSHDMTLFSGTAASGIYRYQMTLALGSYTFYFEFSDGVNVVRLPRSGSYPRPTVF